MTADNTRGRTCKIMCYIECGKRTSWFNMCKAHLPVVFRSFYLVLDGADLCTTHYRTLECSYHDCTVQCICWVEQVRAVDTGLHGLNRHFCIYGQHNAGNNSKAACCLGTHSHPAEGSVRRPPQQRYSTVRTHGWPLLCIQHHSACV